MNTFEFNIYKKLPFSKTSMFAGFGYSLEFIKTIKIKRAKLETAKDYLYTKYPNKNHFIERN